MTSVTKTVRSLDAEAYRAFRAKAVELGYSTGEAISEAMRFWVNAKSKPRVTVRALAEAPAETQTATTTSVDVAASATST